MSDHEIMSNSTQNNTPNEEFAVTLVKGLNFLIAEAENSNQGVPAQIISAARSDIIHWATNIHGSGESQDKFLRQISDENGLLLAIDLVSKYAALKDTKLKKQILSSLKELKVTRDEFANPIFKKRA